MRILLLGLAAVPLALTAIPAQAQEQTAITAISTGAYADAEHALLKELRIHPGRPELLLNLAAVYASTARQAEARNLYERVLAADDVLMDLPGDRTAGSHAVARTGLRRLGAVQVTSR